MEKLLSSLSILIICGTTISSVFAASLHEKQEIKDKAFNLQTEDNLGNLTRYKRASEYDIHDVSAVIKRILNDEVRRYMREENGQHLLADEVTLDLDIEVKSVHEIIPRGQVEGKPELAAKDCTTVENTDDIEHEMLSSEITLKTTLTDTSTIGNTFDFTGELEIASIPVLGSKGKFGFKFSRSSTTTSTISEEITKKLPSQKVTVEPHSRKRVVSELYASTITSNNLVSFEIDESSTYTYKITYNLPIKRDLKPDLEQYRKMTDLRYPTAIYCGLVPCIEFKNNKIYLRYYPLQNKIAKTELYSRIEKLTPDMNENC